MGLSRVIITWCTYAYGYHTRIPSNCTKYWEEIETSHQLFN